MLLGFHHKIKRLGKITIQLLTTYLQTINILVNAVLFYCVIFLIIFQLITKALICKKKQLHKYITIAINSAISFNNFQNEINKQNIYDRLGKSVDCGVNTIFFGVICKKCCTTLFTVCVVELTMVLLILLLSRS